MVKFMRPGAGAHAGVGRWAVLAGALAALALLAYNRRLLSNGGVSARAAAYRVVVDAAAKPEPGAPAVEGQAAAAPAGVASGADADAAPAGVAGGADAAPSSSSSSWRPPPAAEIEARCWGTLGSWCRDFYAQRPVPWRPPPRGAKPCLNECNGVGVCDAAAGWCRCPAGWTGDACTEPLKRPCTQFFGDKWFEPYDEPIDWNRDGNTLRCGGECDDDFGMCFCPANSTYGRRPRAVGSPPEAPPEQFGRQLGEHCQPSTNPHNGAHSPFGSVARELLFGPRGWCEAEAPEHSCPCYLDGWGGPTCSVPYQHFCANQCSGRGDCYLGWCRCHAGYFGHDCAHRAAEEGLAPGPAGGDPPPWVARHAATPAAADPPPRAERLRPLIYVYELPPIFNQLQLQYRFAREACVHRVYDEHANATVTLPWTYAAEPGLHEALLQSEHRTLDPGEADFFYLPLYPACYAWPVFGATDGPWFAGRTGNRAQQMTAMMAAAHAWVRSHHPWWDRRGGRDHIVLAAHDEGSCHVPAALRPAIVLAHWGRIGRGHTSGTAWPPDNYTQEHRHPVYARGEGHLGALGDHACFDPDKDLVIPSMWAPSKYGASALLGGAPRARTILGFFKGAMRPWNPGYARGLRTRLAQLCDERGWWPRHRVWVNETAPPDAEFKDLGYSELLALSTFCLVLPGDGWSARMVDAVVHGCVPVIIQDGVHVSFEGALDVACFSLRVAQKDIAALPKILAAAAADRKKLAAMQRAVARVASRFMYSGTLAYRPEAEALVARRGPAAAADAERAGWPARPWEDDALATILQWLHSRIAATR